MDPLISQLFPGQSGKYLVPIKSTITTTQTQDGVELVYLKDRNMAGIHIAGLARLLDCDSMTVSRAARTVTKEDVFELEMPTSQGLRTVTFMNEPGVMQVLKVLRSGKHNQATKDTAEALYDRFAMAGFKLLVMLKVAPEVLAEKMAPSIEVAPDPVAFADLSWKEQIAAAISLASVPGAVDALAMLKSSPQKAKPTQKVPEPRQAPREALFIPGWSDGPKPRGKWTDADVMQYVRLRNAVEPLSMADAYRLSRTLQRQKIGVHRLTTAIFAL